MAESPLRRLPVKVEGRIRILDCATITHVESEAHYVRVHAGGEQHILRETLTRLEERRDSAVSPGANPEILAPYENLG